MRKIFEILFPFKLNLTILQLEGYEIERYIDWVFKNFTKRNIHTKRGLALTPKLILIITISFFLLIIINFLLIILNINSFIVAVSNIFLLTQPYLLITASTLCFKPFDLIYAEIAFNKTRTKIKSMKKLKVIAVTGSYGKTSVKEYLYQILRSKYRVLRTPESYNTLLGIAKVVKYELDESYDIFICEMGAFKREEIKHLCNMVLPECGILTGISYQHLEKFGSLDSTIKAKFELIDFIKDTKNIIFNLDDNNITTEITKRKFNNITGYSSSDHKPLVYADVISLSSSGSEFQLRIDKKAFKIITPLFGLANVNSVLAAVCGAYRFFGIDADEITKSIPSLKPYSNRSLLINTGQANIIDNTFSSNYQSFKLIIETAKLLRGKKVIVTPGLVELGKMETELHNKLGINASNIFNKYILVGNSNRTRSFALGLNKNDDIEYIEDSRQAYFSKIEQLKKEFDWIFLENDLTENY